MEVIYEEGNSSSPVQPPRKILRASHPTRRSQNNLNRDLIVRNMIKKTRELTLAEKLDLNFDRLETVRVLGEGAFGEVVLVVDRDDISIAAAVKRINLRGLDIITRNAVKKEVMLHRAVKNHQNVLKYLTVKGNDDICELYLEYADGGELFDQIEPDYGMPPARAQYYFKQLIEGLAYIHSCGICHRDIKPENLLLTKDDVLKISDFGMATVFKDGSSIRKLSTRCGTMPYIAPEILVGEYLGEPVDIWSCGVVLVCLLVGELPWEDIYSREYVEYIENDGLMNRPWCRLETTEISFLSVILNPNPNKRATITRIKKHPWFVAEIGYRSDWRRKIPEEESVYVARSHKLQNIQSVPLSQPAHMRSLKDKDSVVLINSNKPRQPLPAVNFFSQPTNFDSMVLDHSQVSCSQFNSIAHPIASLVRRMTRFCVKVSVEEALKAVKNACSLCDCECVMSTSHQLQITCLKNTELSFFATVYEMIDEGTHTVLVDFRLSKGDGIEFKRRFLELKKLMSNIISKNSLSWLEKHGLVCRRNVAANEKDKKKMLSLKENSLPKAAEV